MVRVDEAHWVKIGAELSDGVTLLSSVLTDGVSDWATGVFPGDPEAFWIRATVAKGVNDGNGFCFISHTGEVCPSGFLPLPAGNVREKSVVEIYRTAPLFRSLRDPEALKGRCGVCEFRELCGGSRARAYATTGDYLAEDPSCVFQPEAS